MKNDVASSKKILCIIPARGGSKGLKRKNVRPLNGKPLIAWTIDEAKKSKWIDRIVVSTDDSEIAATSTNLGVQFIRRPDELAQDSSTTADAILHTINILIDKGYAADYILLLQCTSPMRTVTHIDEAIEKFLDNEADSDSLISVTKVEHPPWWYKTLDEKGFMSDFIKYDRSRFTRRQDFKEVYNTNGAIYIMKTEKFRNLMDFETENTLAYVMDDISSIDIDTEADFLFAEFLLKNKT